MAQNVYSRLLCGAAPLTAGVGLVLGVVPEGLVWVVRHVSAWNSGGTKAAVGALELSDELTFPIFLVGAADAVGQRWYGSTLHQALTTGDQILSTTADTGWSVRVSGFALTTP